MGIGDIVTYSYETPGILLNCTGFYYVFLALYHSYVELPYERLIVAEESLKEAKGG